MYRFECECVECGYRWSEVGETPPVSCPMCESNDIEIVKQEEVKETKS